MSGEIKYPTPGIDWESRAFWEGCRRHELILQRCAACAVVQHRPRAVCASCLSGDLEHFRASGRGTIHTFTVTRQNHARGFREALPYILAYVELEEGPRMLTNIVGCSSEEVRIGMHVEVDFVDLDDGELSIPRFKAA